MAVKIIQQPNYKWIDLTNPSEEELHNIAEKSNLNYYNLADSLEPNHLPKFEAEDGINFLIVRIIHGKSTKKNITVEGLSNKVAIFYNEHTIITIHRIDMAFIDDIIEKFAKAGKLPTSTSIVIKILWNVLNTYNAPIIQVFNQLDDLEDNLFLKDTPKNMLQKIYLLKRRVNLSRRILVLSEDVINSIKPTKAESPAFHDLKDLYIKAATSHDQILDNLTNLLNIYISLSSQKTNEIMKTLTIFSIFFLPLTFLAGIYGMNFVFMPELKEKWSYPLILLLMVAITVVIYYWLKRKKWL
ncbi:MAG: hypothetical protein LBT29_01975 [Flavobacteriaceae bacterium]|jgi:magnesium transporter|nr:hypothetical protein [Flavobacteriaceae bacterium]